MIDPRTGVGLNKKAPKSSTAQRGLIFCINLAMNKREVVEGVGGIIFLVCLFSFLVWSFYPGLF
jgi:hypothetical protein